jgi:hypothetical protein
LEPPFTAGLKSPKEPVSYLGLASSVDAPAVRRREQRHSTGSRQAKVRRNTRGLSLFEVMSKAPEAQNPRRGPGLFAWRRRPSESASLMVAQALTEEEAAAELEARRAPEANCPAEAADAEPRGPGTLGVFWGRVSNRVLEIRPKLSLNTVGCLAVAASVCLLTLGAYTLGRRSAIGKGLEPVAALRNVAGSARSPLLSDRGGSTESSRRQAGYASDPDLSELLRQPPAKQAGIVIPNQPASVGKETAEIGVPAEKLNYLQIESFKVTRERNGEQLRRDLADVRAFLAARGVETFARNLGNVYVLLGKQGFPTGQDFKARREEFRREIEQYGQEYRRSGGPYQFRGCFFVSHSRSRAGRPV